MRKDGSKALGGERLSEAQKGAVQLRREPPDFVPVVKQIIIRPREGRVPSAILGGNTILPRASAWSRPVNGRAGCNAGRGSRCGRGVTSSISRCERDGVGATPTGHPIHATAMPKSPRRQAATLPLPGASPGAVSSCVPGKRRERRIGFVNRRGRCKSDTRIQASGIVQEQDTNSVSSRSQCESACRIHFQRGADVRRQHLRLPTGSCEWKSRAPHQSCYGVDWRVPAPVS